MTNTTCVSFSQCAVDKIKTIPGASQPCLLSVYGVLHFGNTPFSLRKLHPDNEKTEVNCLETKACYDIMKITENKGFCSRCLPGTLGLRKTVTQQKKMSYDIVEVPFISSYDKRVRI